MNNLKIYINLVIAWLLFTWLIWHSFLARRPLPLESRRCCQNIFVFNLLNFIFSADNITYRVIFGCKSRRTGSKTWTCYQSSTCLSSSPRATAGYKMRCLPTADSRTGFTWNHNATNPRFWDHHWTPTHRCGEMYPVSKR